ncbi:MAG: DUF922 domain-containing protein [Pyrinomonadaceae bacterium]
MSLHGFKHTLSWSHDFTERSAPPPDKDDLIAFTVAPAETFGGMAIRYDSDSELYSFKHSKVKVKIKMDKSNSWVLKNSKTDKLKKHEQVHYNISALAGRDFERDLKNLTAATPEELVSKRDALNAQMQKLVDDINKEYDNTILWGTDHGRTEMHQGFWELHINKLMNNDSARLESIYAMMRR